MAKLNLAVFANIILKMPGSPSVLVVAWLQSLNENFKLKAREQNYSQKIIEM